TLPEQVERQVHLRRVHHHARAEGDPVERAPIAACDLRERLFFQLSLRHRLELGHADEFVHRCKPLRAQRGCSREKPEPLARSWSRNETSVLPMLRSIDARLERPAAVIACTNSAWDISRIL